MRQEAGLLEYLLADRAPIAEGGPVPHAAQEGPVLREECLRLVAQGEVRFVRPLPGSRVRQRQHLLGCHEMMYLGSAFASARNSHLLPVR